MAEETFSTEDLHKIQDRLQNIVLPGPQLLVIPDNVDDLKPQQRRDAIVIYSCLVKCGHSDLAANFKTQADIEFVKVDPPVLLSNGQSVVGFGKEELAIKTKSGKTILVKLATTSVDKDKKKPSSTSISRQHKKKKKLGGSYAAVDIDNDMDIKSLSDMCE
jgi:hypothetical protein